MSIERYFFLTFAYRFVRCPSQDRGGLACKLGLFKQMFIFFIYTCLKVRGIGLPASLLDALGRRTEKAETVMKAHDNTCAQRVS